VNYSTIVLVIILASCLAVSAFDFDQEELLYLRIKSYDGLNTGLMLPGYQIGGRTSVEAGFYLHYNHIDFVNRNSNRDLYQPDDYYGCKVSLSFKKQLSSRLASLVESRPGFYSDFKSVKSEDLSLQGTILLIDSLHSKLQYGFGAAYLNNFGEPKFLPAFFLNWQFSNNKKLSLNLPVSTELLYDPLDGVEFALVGLISGYEYVITDQAFKPDSSKDYRLSLSTGRIGLKTNVRLTGNLFISLESGWILHKCGDIYNGYEVKLWSLEATRNIYFGAKLSLRRPE